MQPEEIKSLIYSSDNESFQFTTKNCAILGANGSGKSSLSKKICKDNLNHKPFLITAKRSLVINQDSQRSTSDNDLKGNSSFFNSDLSGHWDYETSRKNTNNIQESDFDINLEIVFRDHTSEHRYASQNSGKNGKDYIKPKTKLEKIFKIWTSIFKMQIKITRDGKIKINEEYEIEGLSDGERSALYLIMKCLSAPQNSTIVVDEAETHLNSAILQDLWDVIEQVRIDCSFVYISHNLEFITTRNNCTKFWIKEFAYPLNWTIEKIENNEIPEELILKIIGSKKTKILFVEGENNSTEQKLYQQIYPEFKVQSVVSCQDVINYTKSLRKNLHGNYNKDFFGLIDRDFRSDEEIEKLRKDRIFCLPVAEFEGLFFREEIIKFYCDYYNNTLGDKNLEYKSILEKIKNNIILANQCEKDNYINSALKNLMQQRFNQFLQNYDSNKKFDFNAEKEMNKLNTIWEGYKNLGLNEILVTLPKEISKSLVNQLNHSKLEKNHTFIFYTDKILDLFNTIQEKTLREVFLNFMPIIDESLE